MSNWQAYRNSRCLLVGIIATNKKLFTFYIKSFIFDQFQKELGFWRNCWKFTQTKSDNHCLGNIFLKAFPVHNTWSRLFIFIFRNPQLQNQKIYKLSYRWEWWQRSQNISTNPHSILSLSFCNHFRNITCRHQIAHFNY